MSTPAYHPKTCGYYLCRANKTTEGVQDMKATGIVRRIDDLGRVVIPKEIRRTMRIREADPLLNTLTVTNRYIWALDELKKRLE